MLHEIAPHVLDIEMAFVNPQPDDCALFFRDDDAGRFQVMATFADDGSIEFPTCGDFGGFGGIGNSCGSGEASSSPRFTYLFSVDGRPHFLVDDASARASEDATSPSLSATASSNPNPAADATPPSNPSSVPSTIPLSPAQTNFLPVRDLIARSGDPQAFAIATGLHLRTWYRDNRCCGRCGERMAPSTIERALVCTACGHTTYPRISPAIIVAVTDGDRLLLTRYARGNYHKRALVAGFVEVGETPEEAVVREVWEECGVRVKDVRYFGSQPWGLSGSLMMGFFASLDGDPAISLQDGELSWAGWIPRDELEDGDDYALGRALINTFRNAG